MTANFEGVDVVPLPGAIVVCYGWGGGWTWCHCTVASVGDECRCFTMQCIDPYDYTYTYMYIYIYLV